MQRPSTPALPLLCLIALTASAAPVARAAPGDEWRDAKWVWDGPVDAAAPDAARRPRYFRQTFDLPAAPAAASAIVVVDDNHRLFVNGKSAGGQSGWQTPGRYDVRPLLVAGRNAVLIEAVDTGGQAGAIARLEVATGDGKTLAVATDAKWKVRAADDGAKGAKEPPAAWSAADFDDSAWKPAAVLGPAGMAPWNLLGRDDPGAKVAAAAGKGDGGKGNGGKPARGGDLPPAEQQRSFALPDGYAIDLVAAEPLVTNPVCMALDEQGRIYVAESHTYRYGKSKSPVPNPTNPIVMLRPLPDGKGYERVVVAEGFEDPVMGLLVRGGKMWAAANNYLFLFDVGPDGVASNRRLILEDKKKAWNPFGFFVLRFGPDGLLYLSVGNHDIAIDAPGGEGGGRQRVTSRGGSGIVCRMNPDGTNVEVLTQGFRVPYAYDVDPFGQLWLLSNGEGNPNRFAKVIPGADYHCFSRTNDADWLTGRHPLAPPTFELPRGAATSLLAYYGGAFPADMQGALLGVNWGPHGLGAANHSVNLFVPDEGRRNVDDLRAQWLTSTDPHFRPTTLLVAPDGSLLLADFYNRDDESDGTGRIWRIRHKDHVPPVQSIFDFPTLSQKIAELSSPHVARRESALEAAVTGGEKSIPPLVKALAPGGDPLGAAGALWALARIGTPDALAALGRGAEHKDWKVRRLAAELVRRYKSPAAGELAKRLADDPSGDVRVEAALAHADEAAVRAALVAALKGPAAADRFARYKGAFHLARVADAAAIDALLASADPNVRLAGLITIDVANYEKTPAAPAAARAIVAALASFAGDELDLAIDVAGASRSAEMAAPLRAVIARKDASPAAVAKAALLLQALPAGEAGAPSLGADAVAAALAGLKSGKVPVRSTQDKLAVLRLLALEGSPSPFAVQQVERYIREGGEAGRAASALARSFGDKAPPELVAVLWKLLSPGGGGGSSNVEQRGELLLTVATLEKEPDLARWRALLDAPADGKGGNKDAAAGAPFAREVVRTWRRFAGRPDFVAALRSAAPALAARDPLVRDDLAVVLAQLGASADDLKGLNLPTPTTEEAALRERVSDAKAGGNAALGRFAFERAGCAKCHSGGTDARLGPPLAGVGQQPRQYLIESIFEPSKVIKTGFEAELVETADGRALTGLVREAGDDLVVVNNAGEERVAKKQVSGRKVQKLSIMPEGLARTLSPAELADLIAYLQSLKGAGPAGAK